MGDMQNYDLILDTHTFGLQGSVDIILRALEEKEKTYGKPYRTTICNTKAP